MEKLLKLSKQTIPTLIGLYRNAQYPQHAVTCAALKNFVRKTEKFPEFQESLEILTLNDEWQKDGLFMIKNGQSYYFDSLEPEPFGRLKKLLLTIDYSEEVVFPAFRDQFKPMVNDVIWFENLEITDWLGSTPYFISKEAAAKLPVPIIPEGWKLRNLTLDDMPNINSKMKRKGGDNLGYVENSIKYNMCLGLFDEKAELQGFILGNDLGTMGSTVTTDEHQHRGVAGILGVSFGKIVLKPENGEFDSIWNVDHGNRISHALARKFGAKPIGTVTWLSINKLTRTEFTKLGMREIFYPKL